MVQVCARCLSLPVEKIHISETSTDKIPNASPTAASTGSDLNGMAIKVAIVNIISLAMHFLYLNSHTQSLYSSLCVLTRMHVSRS